eukprot:scaffold9139_cov64-Phaeocystis_antarctica.AAC.13
MAGGGEHKWVSHGALPSRHGRPLGHARAASTLAATRLTRPGGGRSRGAIAVAAGLSSRPCGAAPRDDPAFLRGVEEAHRVEGRERDVVQRRALAAERHRALHEHRREFELESLVALEVGKGRHRAPKQAPLQQGEVALQDRDDSHLGQPTDRAAHDPKKSADAPCYNGTACTRLEW